MSHDLSIRNLKVVYRGHPPVPALGDLSLTVPAGRCLGVLGESGSGKSTLAGALLGLLPQAEVAGLLALGDLDLGSLDESGWRDVRWRRIALAFQSTAALNPVLRVGVQMTEPLQVHLGMTNRDADARVGDALGEMGLGDWAKDRFPHELSGGQRRLVLLAMALVCRPEVVVLDEPTAGLDPVTRRRVLAVLSGLREAGDTTLVMLTHDVDALEVLADAVAVLYRGWLAEVGPTATVLGDPRNPYSWGLLNSRPTLGSVKDLRGIRGSPPGASVAAGGCPFLGRCTQSIDVCADRRPPLVPAAPGTDADRLVSCVRGGVAPVLTACNLHKTYTSGRGRTRRRVAAVDDVSLEVREGEVVGLVGMTGAGKSTVAQLLVRLVEPDSGDITLEGDDLLHASGHALKAMRRRVQMVFQDPFQALSPRMTVAETISELLIVHHLATAPERDHLVRRTLVEVHLPSDDWFLARHTHELSGGQLQRVSLARALVLDPKLLVADEPASMLDPSEQAKMMQLLKQLQVERGMAMVLISHDLAVVLRVADRVLVIDGGQVVEEGSGSQLLRSPRHRVTRALLEGSGRDLLFPHDGGRQAADRRFTSPHSDTDTEARDQGAICAEART